MEIILAKGAKVPEYAHITDAGCDVKSFFKETKSIKDLIYFGKIDYIEDSNNILSKIILYPRSRVLIPTGIKINIPNSYEVEVRPKSGLALKKGISVLNSPGTIDENYFNEIGIIIINHGLEPVEILDNQNIAQFVLNKIEHISWEVVDKFDTTNDRKGGFGSTGE